MKAVMISIRPEWCEKIAQGKKTVEVRKTKDKKERELKEHLGRLYVPPEERHI